jgi:Protein of unknown function (DUF2934)
MDQNETEGDDEMNLAVADSQRQREEVRARLLADEEIRGRIAFRAYEISQHRGNGNGTAFEDWLQAENEIVSSLAEQELQPDSEPTGGKGLKGNVGDSPKARIKSGKKSQPRGGEQGNIIRMRPRRPRQRHGLAHPSRH